MYHIILWGGYRRVLDLLELELQTVVGYVMWFWEPNSGTLGEQKLLLTTALSLANCCFLNVNLPLIVSQHGSLSHFKLVLEDILVDCFFPSFYFLNCKNVLFLWARTHLPVTVNLWKSESNFVELVLLFHLYVSSSDLRSPAFYGKCFRPCDV